MAGYVNKGEDAETALKREMQEEMQLKPVSFRYIRSSYFAKNNVMMMCYLSIADSDDISHYSRWEVDEARWCTYNEATNIVIQGGVAAYLLEEIKNETLKFKSDESSDNAKEFITSKDEHRRAKEEIRKEKLRQKELQKQNKKSFFYHLIF